MVTPHAKYHISLMSCRWLSREAIPWRWQGRQETASCQVVPRKVLTEIPSTDRLGPTTDLRLCRHEHHTRIHKEAQNSFHLFYIRRIQLDCLKICIELS